MHHAKVECYEKRAVAVVDTYSGPMVAHVKSLPSNGSTSGNSAPLGQIVHCPETDETRRERETKSFIF